MLICHPTSNILTKRVLLAICSIIPISIVSGLIGNAIDMRFNYYRIKWTDNEMLFDKLQMFLNNCEAFMVRRESKLIIDAIFCLTLPAFLSGLMYARMSVTLCTRTRDVSRDENWTFLAQLFQKTNLKQTEKLRIDRFSVEFTQSGIFVFGYMFYVQNRIYIFSGKIKFKFF